MRFWRVFQIIWNISLGEQRPHGYAGDDNGLRQQVEQDVRQVVLGQGLRAPQVGQQEAVGLEGDGDDQGLHQLGAGGVEDLHAAHGPEAGDVADGLGQQGAGGPPGDHHADGENKFMTNPYLSGLASLNSLTQSASSSNVSGALSTSSLL